MKRPKASRPELAGGGERRQHSQGDAAVGPDRRGRAAPQEALGHLTPTIVTPLDRPNGTVERVRTLAHLSGGHRARGDAAARLPARRAPARLRLRRRLDARRTSPWPTSPYWRSAADRDDRLAPPADGVRFARRSRWRSRPRSSWPGSSPRASTRCSAATRTLAYAPAQRPGSSREYVLIAWAVLVFVRRRADLDLVGVGAGVLWSVAASASASCRWSASTSRAPGPRDAGSPRSSATTTSRRCRAPPPRSRSSRSPSPAARVDRAARGRGRAQRRRGADRLRVERGSDRLRAWRQSPRRSSSGARWRRVAAILAIAAVAGRRGRPPPRRGHRLVPPLPRGSASRSRDRNVETYTQRTVLVYIGWRIFLDHPAAGSAGTARSEQWAYGPYLADAHREVSERARPLVPVTGSRLGGAERLRPGARRPRCRRDARLPRSARHLPARRRAARRCAGRPRPRSCRCWPPAGCWSRSASCPRPDSSPAIPTDAVVWLAIGLAHRGRAQLSAASRRIASSRRR